MAIVPTLLGAAEPGTTGTTLSVTATSTNGATWVVFAADTTGFGATPITDNKGNTYTQIGGNVSAFGVTGTLWYKESGTGGASHTFTATAVSSDVIAIIVVELTGGVASGILDQSVTGNDDAASPFTSGTTGTTAQANECVLAFTYDNRSSATAITWGGGYTSLVDQSNTSGITSGAAYLITSATGTQQSTFTNAAVTEAVTWIATFKEASSATYTLTAAQGSFTLSGQAAAFTYTPNAYRTAWIKA